VTIYKLHIITTVWTVMFLLYAQDEAPAGALRYGDKVEQTLAGSSHTKGNKPSLTSSDGSVLSPASARRLNEVRVKQSGEESVIVMAADGPLSYRVRPLDSKRIIVDLMHVSTKVRQLPSLSDGLVKQVRMGQHPQSIRLVIDLQKPAVYSVREGKDTLMITLSPHPQLKRSAGKAPEENPAPNQEEAPPQVDVPKPPAQTVQFAKDTTTASPSPEHERIAAAPQSNVRGEKPLNRQTDPHSITAEPYLAVYGGLTIPQSLQHVSSADPNVPLTISNIQMARSGIGGIKLGLFQPSGVRWFGIETEFFYTNPHIKQQDLTINDAGKPSTTDNFSGARLRVATWALNWIVRYPGERFQPYAGVGLGLFWARLAGNSGDNTFGTASDMSLGLNALAGARLVLTKHIAMFGEYKYNRASFDFGNDVSIHALYQAHHFVGGFSWQF
jgi:opacity protein-like surface antigen